MHSLYIQWMPQWIGMKNICFSVTKSAAFMHPRAWHSRALGTSRGVLWTWNIFFYVSFFHYALSVSLFLRFPPMVFLNSLVWSELLSLCAYVCVPVYVIICLCSYRLCFLKMYAYTCLLHMCVNAWTLCVYLNELELCYVCVVGTQSCTGCVFPCRRRHRLNTGTWDFLCETLGMSLWWLSEGWKRGARIVDETNASWTLQICPSFEKLYSFKYSCFFSHYFSLHSP